MKRWQRGVDLIISTNTRRWLPTTEITLPQLKEIVNRKVDELIEKRDEVNKRKINIKEKLEGKKHLKEDERIAPGVCVG